MSRNASGTYSLPLANVVTGATIEASWANTTLSDIATELTDSLSRSGKGNMSAALKIVAGAVGAPGLSFTSEASSGLYRNASNDIRFAVNGADNWQATASGFKFYLPPTLDNVNIVVGTAGKGVDFSANTGTAATGAATTSELLDFYEEGTWTPNLWDASLSSGEGQTYSFQEGYFTRIGELVAVSGRLGLSSLGTLTGGDQARIGPLPYASGTYGAIAFSKSVHNLGAVAAVSGYVQTELSHILLFVADTTSGDSLLTVTEAGAGARLYFSGIYRALPA